MTLRVRQKNGTHTYFKQKRQEHASYRRKAEEDKVVLCYTFVGTHQGPRRGIPPTGKAVILSGAKLQMVMLKKANLYQATLCGADLADTTLENASDLRGTNLYAIKNYPEPQKLQIKGAVFDPPSAAPDTRGQTKQDKQ